VDWFAKGNEAFARKQNSKIQETRWKVGLVKLEAQGPSLKMFEVQEGSFLRQKKRDRPRRPENPERGP